jgi:hypothetical protein
VNARDRLRGWSNSLIKISYLQTVSWEDAEITEMGEDKFGLQEGWRI